MHTQSAQDPDTRSGTHTHAITNVMQGQSISFHHAHQDVHTITAGLHKGCLVAWHPSDCRDSMGRTEKERVDQTEQAEPQKHPQQTHGSTKKCIKKDATSAPPTLSNFQKSKGCTPS
jgi:hypothetical protein